MDNTSPTIKRMLNSKNTIELIEQEIYFMVGKKG